MKRLVLNLTDQSKMEDYLQEAADWIKQGELVAFPTETVYGLGADALNSQAIQKIYLAKGRPSDNPLIAHISQREDLNRLVTNISPLAEKLIAAFWPGPLTLVFQKTALVPNAVTAGGDTVAVRMPDHPIARSLIEKSQTPIAAPSANSSGKPSPTTADHVAEDLMNQNILLLDGGITRVGLESTVIDVTGNIPVLLRSGGIGVEQIEKVVGSINTIENQEKKQGITLRSPGLKYRHYAPHAQVILIKRAELANRIKENQEEKQAVIFLKSNEKFELPNNTLAFEQKNSIEMAQNLFAIFRECDHQQVSRIYVEQIQSAGIGRAIMNRVKRAAENL